MKRLVKCFLMMAICVWGLLFTCDVSYAEEKEADLFTLNESQDVTVTITYEIDDISYELISPSGQIITKDTDTENITVFSGQNATIIFLGQAETGVWKIKYDKGSNESISVSADVQDSSFFITQYHVGTISEEKLPVDFVVTGKENTRYNYKLLLTTDQEGLTGKELANGWATTDENISVEVPFQYVNTYDEYYLLLYVSYDLNGSEIFDYAFSESFAYVNQGTPQAMENVNITINHDSNVIDVSWKDYLSYGQNSVYVAAYNGEECILADEYLRTDTMETAIPYTAGDTIRIEISYKNSNGIVSEILQKEINTGLEILTLPEAGKVGSEIWSFDYKGASNTEVTFLVNEAQHVIVLDGDGSKYITLPENRNNISITYQDADGYIHKYQRMANISKVMPTIELVRQIDGVTTTGATIMISGTTNAEVLTINGAAVEVSDGVFVHQYALNDGDNSIVMEAAIQDSVTRLNATVTKETVIEQTKETWIYLVGGLAISLVGIVIVSVLTWRRNRKQVGDVKKRKSGLGLVINWLLAVVVWIGWIIIRLYEGRPEFLELAYESLDKANKLLLIDKVTMWVAVGVSALALLRTLVRIIVQKIRNGKKGDVNENAK